jgi:hypothetical protein
MKFERLMSGCAMKVNRGAEDGDLNEDGGDDKRNDKRKEHYALLQNPAGTKHVILTRLPGQAKLFPPTIWRRSA